MSKNLHVVIGLEVHAHLITKTKLFSTASTKYGSSPNAQANFIHCALPGTLPVLNQEALTQAIRFGIACNAKIRNRISLDRKNYHYPDLPKGYQITQHYHPILEGGYIDLNVSGIDKRIQIHHSHLEEDAGKSNHDYSATLTGIDLNRAGIPLLEIVSEPEIRSPAEAIAYVKALHKLLVFYNICDGNMQEGSLRIDVNVSLREAEDKPFGTKVEIKNLNSFKFVEKALQYEIARHAEILESGGVVEQQTRLFNEASGKTIFMRGKENAHDYRYHKDPDIPYIEIEQSFIEAIRLAMPESPRDKESRYISMFKLSQYDAKIISQDKIFSYIFEKVISNPNCRAKTAANWVLGPVASICNKSQITFSEDYIKINDLAELIALIDNEKISNNTAKQVFEKMWGSNRCAQEIIENEGLREGLA